MQYVYPDRRNHLHRLLSSWFLFTHSSREGVCEARGFQEMSAPSWFMAPTSSVAPSPSWFILSKENTHEASRTAQLYTDSE